MKKIFICLILCFIILFNVRNINANDKVTFKDENLKKLVIEKLGLKTSDVSINDMKSLKDLDTPENDPALMIKDITGLEYAINLESLDLGYNKVIDLTPIRNLTSLKSLKLDYNNDFEDLDSIANLTSLTYLSLVGLSHITSFNGLKNLVNLEYLNLSITKIDSLDFIKDLTKLKKCYLAFNNISDLSPLANLKDLNTLALNDNYIQDIASLSGLTSLKFLYLDNNFISDFSSLLSLTNLETLSVKRNYTSDASVLNNLVGVEILSNPARTFEESFYLNKSEIYLTENEVFILKPLLLDFDPQLIEWKSSDESIAKVSGGIVRVLKSGVCKITATYNGTVNTCFIYPSKRVKDFSINLKSLALSHEMTLEIIKNSNYHEYKEIKVTSSNPDVLSVNGLALKGLKKGETILTITVDGITKRFNVSVGEETVTNTTLNVNTTNINSSITKSTGNSKKDGCFKVGSIRKVIFSMMVIIASSLLFIKRKNI